MKESKKSDNTEEYKKAILSLERYKAWRQGVGRYAKTIDCNVLKDILEPAIIFVKQNE